MNHVRYIGIRSEFKDRRASDWALVTRRFEINGKMYALSQYLTWLYRDFSADPVERIMRRSMVSFIHQDPFLIEAMLDDIANIFKEVIEWKGGDVKSLVDRVALFQYELAHAMPFARGSAAVAEWFEMAIYRFHGFDFRYNPEVMVNLEALVSSPKEFIDKYGTMIELRK